MPLSLSWSAILTRMYRPSSIIVPFIAVTAACAEAIPPSPLRSPRGPTHTEGRWWGGPSLGGGDIRPGIVSGIALKNSPSCFCSLKEIAGGGGGGVEAAGKKLEAAKGKIASLVGWGDFRHVCVPGGMISVRMFYFVISPKWPSPVDKEKKYKKISKLQNIKISKVLDFLRESETWPNEPTLDLLASHEELNRSPSAGKKYYPFPT